MYQKVSRYRRMIAIKYLPKIYLHWHHILFIIIVFSCLCECSMLIIILRLNFPKWSKCSFSKRLLNNFQLTYNIGQIYSLKKQGSLSDEEWNSVRTLQENFININAKFSSSALQKGHLEFRSEVWSISYEKLDGTIWFSFGLSFPGFCKHQNHRTLC